MLTLTKQTGSLGISKLKLTCSIGILPHEEREKQDVFADIEVGLDFSKCLEEEDLENTIDYRDLAEACKRVAEKRHYRLIETLCGEILDALDESFPIAWAKLRLEKPSALLPFAASCFVQMERNFSNEGP